MSNLPPAARRQVQEADRQIAALKAGADPASLPGATPVNANAPPPAPAPAAAPSFPNVGAPPPADAVPVAATPGQPTNPTVKIRPAAPAPAPAAAAPPDDATGMPAAAPGDADHRYRVLQGKYTAERRRDAETIRQLQENNNRLIAQLGAAPAAAVAAPTPPPAPQTPEQRALSLGITKQEITEYGPELIDMIIRAATNITAPEIRRLAAEQQRLSGAVQTTVANVNRTARELVYDALESQLDDWNAINDSPEFIDWLDQVDVISGQTRRSGLMKAFEVNDATRVVGIFKAFLAEDERSRQSTARTRQVDPATLLAPGTPAGGGAPAPLNDQQSGRIWLESEVENFYAAKRRNHWKNNKAEEAALEAEIMAALAQGRIRPTVNDAGIANAR